MVATLTWTDPPLYGGLAIITAKGWNESLNNNMTYLHTAKGFRHYFNGVTVPNLGNYIEDVSSHSGTASGGTWRIKFRATVTNAQSGAVTVTDYISGALNYNCTSLEVSYALQGFPGFTEEHRHGGLQNNFTITGTSLNLGFTIEIFPSRFQLLGIALVPFTTDISLLIGDTIDVTVLTDVVPYYQIPIGPAYPYNEMHIDSGGGSVGGGGSVYPSSLPWTGLWQLHGQVKVGGFGTLATIYLINQTLSNIVLASAQLQIDGFGNQVGSVSFLGRFEEGDSLGLFSSRSGMVGGSINTFLEGYWRGA